MGFTRAELESFRDMQVPDLVADGPVRLVIVGINPSLWTAGTQTHFAHPGNRFYPALHRAGIIRAAEDHAAGLTDAEREDLTSRGIAITNLVNRATARASELSDLELRRGARDLADRVRLWQPAVVAIVGITAYRIAFDRPRAVLGRQDEDLAGAELWAVPNPSGLNAHETTDSLAAWYRQVAMAAQIPLS